MQRNSYKNYFRQFMLFILCAAVLSGSFIAAYAQTRRPGAPTTKSSNAVCPDPTKPCHHREKKFDNWELSFRLPAKIKPNVTYESAPFYAVILKKYTEGCDELDSNPTVEPERIRLQKLYRTRKVFAEYSCPNMAAVGYDFAGKMDASGERVLYMDYIAIYAGATLDEAKKLLEELREEFPEAEVKKMTANYTRMEQ